MKTDNTLIAADVAGGRAAAEDRIWGTDTGRPRAGAVLTVSSLLRGIGGLVIVAAFLMYLFQGWRDGDQLTRTLILLAHTGVLTLAGFAAGHWLKEAKGARLFIALALIAIPVDFAFLGGLTYDHLTWDPAVTGSLMTPWGPNIWQQSPGDALGSASALGVAGISIVVLGLAVLVGFLVMARRSAVSLSSLYLMANGALLVPTRAQGLIAAMLLVLAVVLAVASVRLRRADTSLATPEGVFARVVLVLPLLVLGGRSIWLYAPDGLFFTSLVLLGYLGLRLAVGASARWQGLLQGAAVVLAAISALLAFATLEGLGSLSNAWLLPLTGALFAGLLVDLSTAVRTGAAGYRTAAALSLALVLLSNLALFGGLGNAAACVAFGLGATIWAYTERLRWVFATGLVSVLCGLGVGAHLAIDSFSIGGWTGLVLAGIATIVAGSMVERYSERIKLGVTRWNRHFEPSR